MLALENKCPHISSMNVMGPTAIPHSFATFWFTRICICHAQAIVIKVNMILGFHLMVNMPNGLIILLFQYLS